MFMLGRPFRLAKASQSALAAPATVSMSCRCTKTVEEIHMTVKTQTNAFYSGLKQVELHLKAMVQVLCVNGSSFLGGPGFFFQRCGEPLFEKVWL